MVPNAERFNQGLVLRPEPFGAEIRVRGEGREAVVRREWREAQRVLDENGQWKVVPEGLAFGSVMKGAGGEK